VVVASLHDISLFLIIHCVVLFLSVQNAALHHHFTMSGIESRDILSVPNLATALGKVPQLRKLGGKRPII
jgi:hypothetical protein